jgi:3-oxoadipate enol-lactonase
MKVKTNGIEINFEIEGEGPWVTLSHSLACNLHMWDEQMAALTRDYKVLRFDTRGHGGSSAPPGPYTLEQMADDVKGMLDALNIRETHWVGLSMGGMIGETFALKYPGVFRSLVIADSSAHMPPATHPAWADRIRSAQEKGMDSLVESTLARWFTAPFHEARKDVIARIAADIRATPVAGFVGCCQAIVKLDLLGRLKEIKCPALVMVGEKDPGTPPEMSRAIAGNLPGAELRIIESAAHLSNIEQAAAFNEALLGFLAKVR